MTWRGHEKARIRCTQIYTLPLFVPCAAAPVLAQIPCHLIKPVLAQMPCHLIKVRTTIVCSVPASVWGMKGSLRHVKYAFGGY